MLMTDDDIKLYAVLEPIKESSGLSMLDPFICHCDPNYDIGDYINVTAIDDSMISMQIINLYFRPYTKLIEILDSSCCNYYNNYDSEEHGDDPWTWCYICKPDDLLDSKIIQ